MKQTKESLTQQRLRHLFHYDQSTGRFWRNAEPRKEETIAIERLKEVLDYDPENGRFFWKQKTGRKNVVGQEAGYLKVVSSGHSYKYIRIDGVAYLAGRLAWFYAHGKWPRVLKFHDGNALNYALDNLDDPDVAITDKSQRGYGYIRIDGRDYTAAQVAWFWVHGEWPKGILRFIDGNKENFCIGNLRDSAESAKTDQERYDARKAHYEVGRDHARNLNFQRNFGITLEKYNEMHASQNGVCAICGNPETIERNGKPRWLAVDHCHDSQKVRGLLCGNCNPMIGYAKDNIQVLEKAITYLNSYSNSGAA